MFSFQATLARPLDRVRILAGDAEAADHTLEDETIETLIETAPNVELAAAEARDLMAAIWSSRLSSTPAATDVSSMAVRIPDGWQERTDEIRRDGLAKVGVPLIEAL